MFRQSLVIACLTSVLFGALVFGAVSVDRLRFEAVQLLQQGRYAQAEPLLENLLDKSPSATHTYLLGLCRLKRWRLDSAAELLRAATTAEPDRHAWLNTYAECQLERGRCDLAIELLDKAVAKADHSTYQYNRAMCRLNLGEIDLAEMDLREVLRISPDHPNASIRLAEIMINSGKMSDAERLLAPIVLENATEEALFLIARAQVVTGNHQQAEENFRAVLDSTPGHTGALYGLARLLIAEGRQSEGQTIFDRFNAAQAHQEEIENFRDHLANHPRDTDTRLRLARVLAEIGNNRECRKELEFARRASPENPEVYRLMAQQFRVGGKIDEAKRADDLVLELEASQP